MPDAQPHRRGIAAFLTRLEPTINVFTPDRFKSELFLICLLATGLGSIFTLLLAETGPIPFSEFLAQHLTGGIWTLGLSAIAIVFVLGRHCVSLSALYTKAFREKEQGQEKLQLLSAKLDKLKGNRLEPTMPDAYESVSAKSIPVLLVDDHAMVRQGLRSLMESFPNIEVVGEASNGQEAVKLVEKRRPSVVLMDINMPKLNGIEATAKIKTEHPEIAVIGLSVNAESANREAMKKAGANMLLPKEAVVTELYNAIVSVSTANRRKAS